MSAWIDTIGRLVKQIQSARAERDPIAGTTTKRADPPTRRIEHGVQIVYSPDLDGDADPGEVVWAWVPYEEDPHRGKDRPVVIVGFSTDARGRHFAAVPLTSKNKGRNDHVPVGTGAWDPQHRESWAKVDRLLAVDAGDVRREGAILDRARFDDLIGNLARYHDLVGT